MWTVSHVFYAGLFVLVVGVVLWDAGYFRRGRHRGVHDDSPHKIREALAKGIQLGIMTPNDARAIYGLPEQFTWTGSTTTANPSLHDLFWEDHGRWGDVSVDLADYSPVRGVVAGGDPGDTVP
jgi:hypothetical protein